MPYPPELLLLQLQVMDIDISNNAIDFTLSENVQELLTIENNIPTCKTCDDPKEKKTYATTITTLSWLKLSESLTFTVTATVIIFIFFNQYKCC